MLVFSVLECEFFISSNVIETLMHATWNEVLKLIASLESYLSFLKAISVLGMGCSWSLKVYSYTV